MAVTFIILTKKMFFPKFKNDFQRRFSKLVYFKNNTIMRLKIAFGKLKTTVYRNIATNNNTTC